MSDALLARPAISPQDATVVALKIKFLLEQTIPCELKRSHVTKPHSPVLIPAVVQLVEEAGGAHPGCVVFCLLVCLRWFRLQAHAELYDAELNQLRAVACEVLAKLVIEKQDDKDFLFRELLLRSYSVLRNGRRTAPVSALAMAVDLHACRVISTSGYQKCITLLWNGFLVDTLDQGPGQGRGYIIYPVLGKNKFWAHVDLARIRVPRYQHAATLGLSVVFLGLYTAAVNTISPREHGIDAVEMLLYLFMAGFIGDEVTKMCKIGRSYINFWNLYNLILYALIAASLIVRCVALTKPRGTEQQIDMDVLSYSLLAFCAPFVWSRMLLYLDMAFRFFGTMLIVLKEMMKESAIFFALLLVLGFGFMQAFLGYDSADDGHFDVAGTSLKSMVESLLSAPAFGTFDDLAPPFGMITYYAFSFITSVFLLNILVALYTSAYDSITDNAVEEYLALVAYKTLNFIRAPDEHIFIPPFNLIEIFLLVLPLEWWMIKEKYDRVAHVTMMVLYSPYLLGIAFFEMTFQVPKIQARRRRGEEDDDQREEWEEIDLDLSEWKEVVRTRVPGMEDQDAILELRNLKAKVQKLSDQLQQRSDCK